MNSKLVFAGVLLLWWLQGGCLYPDQNLLFAEEINTAPSGDDQLLNRIDFGNAYIMGQSIKSGAVYLMHRKKSDIKSMLKSREDYRDEILENLTIVDSESKPDSASESTKTMNATSQ